jgi:hypothetical protein
MRRILSLALALPLVLAATTPSLAAADKTMTTKQRLAKYADDLREMWVKYPSAQQKATRDQAITDLQSAYSREVRELDPPKGQTVMKATETYIAALEEMFTLFPTERTKNERNLYMRGCSVVFKQDTQRATDASAARTTQDCFDMLLTMCELAVGRLGQERCKEARTEATNSFNTLFGELSSKASIPEKVDPVAQMADNIKEARRRFPMAGAAEDRNKAIVQMLENAAKRIQQRAITKK